ncbi:MAG: chemotaxis-specific protein-glutamate methyltransferase CheB [Bacteroidales bacterium]
MGDNLTHKKIKVLIVEDSALIRKMLNNILESDGRFEVVAEAINGQQAVRYTKLFNPDVISMDIFMPVMDGLEATYEIMRNHPVPIVIVSSIYKENDVHIAIQELSAGAVAIFPKPLSPNHPNYHASASKYKNLLKLMSEVKVIRRTNSIKLKYDSIKNDNEIADNITTDYKLKNKNSSCLIPRKVSIIAIGASAGGPEAIRTILELLTHPLKAPIVIIQHIDHNFTEGYATWLQQFSKNCVKIASSGEKLRNNTIYIAPGGTHLTITNNSNIKLTPPIKGNNGLIHTPSIDALFESIIKENPKECIAILLSGMGKDGAKGLKGLKESGAYTLIQSESTSLIFGMPGEAQKLGAQCKELSPQEIAIEINYLLNR